MGGVAAFIDAEHALDPAYAGAIGVDTDNLLVSQPDNGFWVAKHNTKFHTSLIYKYKTCF